MNVPESWNTTFHSDETRAITLDTMLSPPVIRKLTYCSHSELRAHAQEVNHNGGSLVKHLSMKSLLSTHRISTKFHFQCLRLLLDVQQHGKWRFFIEFSHRRRWLRCSGWRRCTITAADATSTNLDSVGSCCTNYSTSETNS